MEPEDRYFGEPEEKKLRAGRRRPTISDSPPGMTKQAYLEMRLSDAIAEEDDYDLMVMGRTRDRAAIVL